MGDTTEFGISLQDRVSGPAHDASSALRGVRSDLSGVASAAAEATSATNAVSSALSAASRAATKGVAARKEYRRAMVAARETSALRGGFGGALEGAGAKDAIAGQAAWRSVFAKSASAAFSGQAPSRATRAMVALKEAAVGAWAKLGGGGAARDAEHAFESAGRSAEHAGGFFRRAFEFATGTLIERGLEGVMHIGKELALSTVHAAAFGQSSELAFNALAKGGARGKLLLEHSKDLAQELGMDLYDTTHAYQALLAAQFNPDQADAVVKLGSDLRAIGATSDQVRLAWANMEQVWAKGKADMMDFRQFASYGISEKLIFENMAKRMKVSVDQIPQMIAAGKAKSGVAMAAIADTIKQKLHEANLGDVSKTIANETMGGLWQSLKTSLQRINTDLGDAIAPSLTAELKSMFSDLQAFTKSSEGKQFFKDFAAGIRDLAHAIVEALPHMRDMLGLAKTLVTNRVDGVNGGPKGEAFSSTGALFGGAAGAGLGGAPGAAVGAAMGGGLAAWINNSSVGKAVNEFFGLKEFANASTDAAQVGSDIADGMVSGMTSRMPDVQAAGVSLGQAAISGTQATLEVHSPSRAFFRIGSMGGRGLGLGFVASTGFVASAASNVADSMIAATSFDSRINSRSLGTDGLIPSPSRQFGAAGIGASAPMRAPGFDGRISITVQQTFTGSHSAREVEEASKRGVMEGAHSLFERLSEEFGA